MHRFPRCLRYPGKYLLDFAREHDYSLSQLLQDATSFGTNNDVEYYKAVLRGEIPVDYDDECLEYVGVSASLDKCIACNTLNTNNTGGASWLSRFD